MSWEPFANEIKPAFLPGFSDWLRAALLEKAQQGGSGAGPTTELCQSTPLSSFLGLLCQERLGLSPGVPARGIGSRDVEHRCVWYLRAQLGQLTFIHGCCCCCSLIFISHPVSLQKRQKGRSGATPRALSFVSRKDGA